MNLRLFPDRIVWLLPLSVLSVLVIFDARYHFDGEHMELKQRHQSPQRNWSIHYGQSHVYQNSSLRYEQDFNNIKALIEPGFVLLSDLATSYYAAVYLSVYVKNIHRHHGRAISSGWSQWLDSRDHCYLDNAASLQRTQEFIARQKTLARKGGDPVFRYIIINTDRSNRHLRTDCFSARGAGLLEPIKAIADLKYAGDYLHLYELR